MTQGCSPVRPVDETLIWLGKNPVLGWNSEMPQREAANGLGLRWISGMTHRG